MRKILLFIFSLSIFTSVKIYSQSSCPTCSAVTSFTANLSSNPNNTYTVNSGRSGLCCQGSGSDRCVRFEVSVHPSATQIQFLVSTGNNGTWEINCLPPLYTPTSKPCLNGLTNFCITYCNPGAGTDTYTITTSTGLGTGADLNLRGGCTGSLTVRGLLESTINWTSVYPGAVGTYTNYLSCLSGCDTTKITPLAGAPAYIDYKVCGSAVGCVSSSYCDTQRVYITPALTFTINPAAPVLCSASSGSLALTTTITGGNPPYTYSWSPGGLTTPSISVNSPGTYSVSVNDNTSGCGAVTQSIVVASATTPTVSASPSSQALCSGQTTSITLSSNSGTATYSWVTSQSGVTGATNGSGSSITQTLTATGLSSGTVVYTITPTDAGCSGNPVIVTVTVNPAPTITATPVSQSLCSGGITSFSLISNVSGTTYSWTPTQINVTGASASSGSLIAQSLTATTTGSGSVIYTITPVYNSCFGVIKTVSVTVNPVPTVTATPSSQSLCSGNTTSITLTSGVAGTTYSWTVAQTGVSGASASSGTLISQALSATGTTTGTAVYTITPTANGCNGTPVVITVTVNPTPSITATPGSQSLCSGNASNIALTSNVAGTTFSWTVVQTNITGASASTGSLIAQTLSTTTTSSGTAVYSITSSANSCGGSTQTVTVSVNPAPTVTATPASQSLCSGNTTSITLTSGVAGTTYSWTVAQTGVSGASASSGTLISQALSATGTSTGTAIYTITPTANGCNGTPVVVTVTVTPAPTITATPGSQSLCSGNASGITLTSNVAGTTFSWTVVQTNITGASASTGSLIAQTLSTTTTSSGTAAYSITSSANNCGGSTQTVTVTVNPKPVMTSTNTAAICSGNSFSIALTSNVASTYTWIAGNNANTTGETITSQSSATLTDVITNSVTTSQIVNYTVTPTSTGGSCAGTSQTIAVTVSPAPSLTATPASQSLCSGNTTSITLTSGVAGTTYSWTVAQTGVSGASASSGTLISQALSATGTTTGTAIYTITPTANGCNGTPIVVTITVNPTPSITATPGSQSLCSGNASNIALTSNVAGTTFSWTVAQTNITGASASTGSLIAQTLSTTTTSSGTAVYSITSSANSCGGSTQTVTVTVNPAPTVTATPGSQSLCSGNTSSIALTSNVAGATYSWTVTQTGISGASASSGTLISQALSATGTSTGTAIYTITPTANGCNGTPVVVTVTVTPAPTITATPGSQSLCSGNVSGISLTSNVAGTTFSWTVVQTNITGASASTGSLIAQTLSTTTTSSGTAAYSITSSANNCGGSTQTVTVTVNPKPVMTSTNTAAICSGNSFSIALTSNVASTYTWIAGNNANTTGETITSQSSATLTDVITNSVTTSQIVNYTVTPTSTGGSCAGTSQTIAVTVSPAPTVTVTPSSQSLCSGNTTSITLTSGVAGTTYSWTVAQTGVSGASASSGTLISQALSATGTTTGTAVYTITPTANGCSGIPVVVTITVNPTPSITATPGSQSLCSGNANNIALTSNVTGTTFSWTVVQTNITGASASTGSLIAQTLSTTTTSSGTAVYSITSSANSCGGSTQTVTVTVNPTPVMTSTTTGVICSAGTITIPLTSNVVSAYTWIAADNSNTSGESITTQSTTTINNTITNSTTSVQIVVYTVTPTSTAGSCIGAFQTVSVTINPTPVMTNTDAAIACSASSFSIALTSNVASTYTWIAANNASTTGESITSQTLTTLSNTITNNTTSPQIVIYTVTPTTSAGSCAGVSQTIAVTVNPKPVMTSTNTAAICSGNSFSIALTSNVASTYTWMATDNSNTSGESITTQSSNLLSDVITNNLNTSQIVIYTVSPTSTGGGCLGTSQTISVTVNTVPTLTSATTATICSGGTVVIPLSGNVSSTYTWIAVDNSNTTGESLTTQSTATINNTIISSIGTAENILYNVTPTSIIGSCIGGTKTITVTISPTPVAVLTPSSQIICSGNTATISLSSNVSGTTYSWTTSQSNASGASAGTGTIITQALTATGLTPGLVTYSVMPIIGSCSGSNSVGTITVNPLPTVTATPGSQLLCSGNTTSISLSSNVSGTTYSWTVAQTNVSGASAGTGSVVAQNLSATSSVQGNVSYTIIPTANGCAGIPIVVSVSVNPTPSLTVTPSSQALCSGSTTSLTSSSDVSGTTYLWTVSQTNASGASSGSGATITQTLTATTTGLGTAIYTITPSATSCFGIPVIVTVSVSPIPATPTPTNNGPVCVNGTLSLSTGTLSGAFYNWSGPNSFTASVQNPTVTNIPFAGAGVYTVNVSVNGCMGPNKTTTVIVNPPPPTTLSISSNSPLCSTKILSLSVATVPSATYSWSGPNSFNSTLQNPTITNASTLATGVYSITATVSGCGSSATETLAVIVNPTPAAPIAGNNGPLCVGATLNLTASGTATTYSWTGPGGFIDINQNPTINNITLSQAGVYSVTATSLEGCTSNRGTTTLVINPIPTTPTLSSNSPICVGQTISLTTGSVSGAGYSWNGPNSYTSAIQNPSITNAGTLQTGTYSLNIIVNNCPSLPGTVDVSVNDAASTPTATAGIACFSDTLFLFANSTGGATFTWVGPNGFTSSIQDPFIPNVTLAANGIYTVIAYNGCASTPGMVTVSVTPKPATPVASSNSPLCEGSALNLAASNTGTSYFWAGPNTFTAAVQNPTITNISLSDAGVYSVTAMANGCSSNTRTLNIVINPIPVTPAIGNTSPVCTGQSFNLTVTPVAGATYTWSGPNSYTNSIQTPTLSNVTLSQAGTYSLVIEVNGCVSNSVAVTSVTINNTPSAPVAANNGPLCEGDNLNLTASGSETSYSWSGPLGYIDLNQNPVVNSVSVTQSGTYSVTATTDGCTSPVATTTVVINLIPATPTASATTPVCVGQTVSLTTTSVTTASYNWSGPNSYTSSVQNPSITNASVTNSGTYSINIIVNGCSSSTGTIDVAVNSAATSPTVSSNSPVCSKDSLFLFANSDPGSTYAWSGPNGFNSILQNTFIANTTTLATGNYTVLANNGCSSIPSVVSVTVNQTPATPVITSNSPVCLGSTLNLSATLLVGGNYNWTGPNGFSGLTQSVSIPNTATSEQGTYSVSVTKDGCTSLVAVRNVTVTIPPLANAGTNQTVCANNAMVALTGTVSGGSSTGIWSSAGSGTFTPGTNTLITSYIPSNADTAAGSIKLILTSTNNGGCPASTSSITIVITDAPVAIAGSNFSVCANNANINLNGIVYGGSNSGTWLSSGSGTFTPDANTLNAVYIPSSADVSSGLVTFTLTTTNNGQCLDAASQMTVNITNAPVVFAGPDQITCKASPNALLSGTVNPSNTGTWTTLGSGGFNPDPNSLNTTYIPSTADTSNGSVLLVLTSGNNVNCLAVTDTVKISFSDIPTVNAGSSQTVCANNSVVALTGTITGGGSAGIWTSSGTGTFTPGATILNASYIPSAADTAAGIVTLTLTSTSGCVVVSDNINISITPAPFVFAGANISVCANNAIATYSGSISGITTTGIWTSSGTGTFTPSATTLNGTYTPSPTDITNGSVFLILSSTDNLNCNATIDSLRLIITPPPSAFAGNDTSICASNSLVLNGLIVGGTGAGNWSTSGTGTFTPVSSTLAATYVPSASDTTAHQVTLTLTSINNGGCLAATDDLTLTITPAPTIFAGGDQVVCTDNKIVNLNGEVTVASGMEWTTLGDGTFGSFNSSTTSYTIGTNDISNGQVKIVVTSTGNGDCVTVTDTMNIQIEASPIVNAGNNQFVCQGTMVVNLNGSISGATSTGTWTTLGSGNFGSLTNLSTTYSLSTADTTAGSVKLILTSTNNGSCNPVIDTLLIKVTPAGFATVGNDTTVCSKDTIISLSGVIFGGTGVGQWSSNGTGTFNPSNTALNTTYVLSPADIVTGNVIIRLTPINSCQPQADSLEITIDPMPVVNAGTDQNICSNINTAILSGTVTGGNATGTWTTLGIGSFSPDANTLNSVYTISSTDSLAGFVNLVLTSTNNGMCNAATDTVKISIINSTTALVGNDTTICSIDSLALNGSIIGGTQGIWTSNGSGEFHPDNTSLNATYVPGLTDISTGSVIIKLTPTSGCQFKADSLILILNLAPVVNAGSPITICASTSTVALNGTITGGGTTGVWTTLGIGSFSPDANALNGIYNVSSADSLAGFVNLVLTSTTNSVCNSATDTVKIFITNSTAALVGNDTTICSIDSLVLNGNIIGGTQGLWTSNGSGVFHPDNTSLNATYVPGSTDISNGSVIIKLTPTSGCQLKADSLTLTLNLAPTVNAGLPVTICASTTTVALNGTITGVGSTGVWTTLGIGSFSPDANTLNSIYTVSSADSLAGFVNLVLTSTNNDMCSAVTDTVKIFISNSTTALVGNDTTICSMDSLALNGSIIGGAQGLWTSNGSGVFHPDNLSLNATYVPGSTDITNGSVIIKLTPTSGCQIFADSLTLTLNLAPTVNAGPPVSAICSSTNAVNLNGTITGGGLTGIWTTTGSGIFLPNDSTLNPIYQLSSADSTAGTVTLFLTTTHNGSCGSAKDSIKINSTTPAFAFVSNDFAVCANNASTVLSGTITGGVGEGQWTSNGTGSFIPNDTTMNTTYVPGATDISTGNVTIKLTPINACSPTADSLILTITPSPTVGAGTDIVICKGLEPINLLGSVNTIPTGAVWNTNGLGIFNPNDSTLNATYVPSITDNDTLFFVLTTTGNGLCNAVSDSMFVFRNAKPVADFTYSNLCVGQSAAFNDGSSVGTSTITLWNWNFGDGNTSINQNPANSYSVNGTYSVSLLVKNSEGCSDSITKVIRIHPTPVSTFTFATTCLNDSVRFANSSSVSQGTIASMNWNFGDGDMSTIQNPAHLFDSVKVYNVALTVTSDSGCISVMTQTVNINPTPIAGFNIASSCGSSLVNLTDISTVSSGTVTNWNWTFGDANVSIAQNPTNTYSATGAYTISLQVQSNNGCIDTATAVVNLSQSVLAAYIPHGGTYNVNENVLFTNQSTGASSYEWSFGDGSSTDVTTNPSHGFTNPGNYSVTLIASNGSDCVDTIAYVFEIKTSGYTVPGAFTPNGDGLNDEFSIIGGPFSSYELRVFNEWGHQIFISSLQSDKWDGTYKGASQPAGTYVYIFNGKVLDGEEVKLKGEVNIIR